MVIIKRSKSYCSVCKYFRMYSFSTSRFPCGKMRSLSLIDISSSILILKTICEHMKLAIFGTVLSRTGVQPPSQLLYCSYCTYLPIIHGDQNCIHDSVACVLSLSDFTLLRTSCSPDLISTISPFGSTSVSDRSICDLIMDLLYENLETIPSCDFLLVLISDCSSYIVYTCIISGINYTKCSITHNTTNLVVLCIFIHTPLSETVPWSTLGI